MKRSHISNLVKSIKDSQVLLTTHHKSICEERFFSIRTSKKNKKQLVFLSLLCVGLKLKGKIKRGILYRNLLESF